MASLQYKSVVPIVITMTLLLVLLISSKPATSTSRGEALLGRCGIGSSYSLRKLVLEFEKPVDGYVVLNSSVRRALPFIRPGARRYVDVPVFFALRVNGIRAELLIPSELNRVSVNGPFSANVALVPFTVLIDVNDFGGLDALTLEWPVVEGHTVVLELLPFLNGSYPTFFIEVSALDEPFRFGHLRLLDPNAQLAIGRTVPEVFFAASRFVLPPLGKVDAKIKVMMGNQVQNFSLRIIAEQGSITTIREIAQLVLQVNKANLEDLQKSVYNIIESLESNGFYIGNTRALLSIVEKDISVNEEMLEEVFGQRLAYSMLKSLKSYLLRLEEGPEPLYALLLSVAEAILCIIVGWRLSEKLYLKVICSLALFAIAITFTSILIPNAKLERFAPASLAATLGVFASLRAVLRLRSVQGASTVSGATLEGLLSSTVSFSISFLARRRLRAILLLFTTASVAFGATCITAITMRVAISHQTSNYVPGGINSTYLVARGSVSVAQIAPVNFTGLMFLGSRSEIVGVAPSAIAIYPMNPYATVGGLPVSAIIGLTRDSPASRILEGLLLQGSVDSLRAGAIIISDAMANAAGKGIGGLIELRGDTYEIVGIFDSQKLYRLKDIDGENFLPTIVVGMMNYQPPAEGVVFMHYQQAVFIGASTYKVYLKLAEEADSRAFAKTLSLLGGLSVSIASPGKIVETYYPGYHITVVGAELIIPAVIALLIIFTFFSGFIHEVRRDVFIFSTLGATPDQVFLQFMVMAFIVGFSGGVAGYLAGLLAFRAFSILNVQIPVDVKLDVASLLFSIAFPVVLALLGAMSPASRAIIAAVPSLRRRFAPEAEEVARNETMREVILVTQIPVMIRNAEKAREFAEFLQRRLSEIEMTEHKQRVCNVSMWKEGDGERQSFLIYFEYVQIEKHAFKSYNKVRIQRSDWKYVIVLESKIVTAYTRFARGCLRDVASLIRMLSLEWRALH